MHSLRRDQDIHHARAYHILETLERMGPNLAQVRSQKLGLFIQRKALGKTARPALI